MYLPHSAIRKMNRNLRAGVMQDKYAGTLNRLRTKSMFLFSEKKHYIGFEIKLARGGQ